MLESCIYIGIIAINNVINLMNRDKQLKHDAVEAEKRRKHNTDYQLRQFHAEIDKQERDILARQEEIISQHNLDLSKENWPLTCTPKEYARTPMPYNRRPLKVLLSPPKGKESLGADLEAGIRETVQKGFSVSNHRLRPVEFIGGVWKKDIPAAEGAMKTLYHWFSMEPTLLIDIEFSEGSSVAIINVAYWGFSPENTESIPTYVKVGEFPVREFAIKNARNKAREWRDIMKLKPVEDFIPEYISHNIKTLNIEEDFKEEAPKPIRDLYLSDPYMHEAACEMIPALQVLVAGMADIFHLLRHHTPPYLPQLLPTMMLTGTASSYELISEIITDYSMLLNSIRIHYPALTPLFQLELAESCKLLPDQSIVKANAFKSLKQWLSLYGIELEDNISDPLSRINNLAIDTQEIDYLTRLSKILESFDSETSTAINEFLQRISSNTTPAHLTPNQLLKSSAQDYIKANHSEDK
jgi:hypothetical protein